MAWMMPFGAVLLTGVLICLLSRFESAEVKPKPAAARTPLYCSFCGKSQQEVKKLIAGPRVYICEECIGLCNEIIAEDIAQQEASPAEQPSPPQPRSPDRQRLLNIYGELSADARTMRQVWIIEDPESASIIHAMADHIRGLARALHAELRVEDSSPPS